VAIDKRHPQTKWLCHSNQSVVDGAVTVRVEFTHHFAGDAGRFDVPAVGAKAHLTHLINNSAVYGFQAISSVW
jgi:hypothetical protein